MARSDTDEYCQTPGNMDTTNMVQDLDTAALDRGNDATIHSGHFMVSYVHDRELEEEQADTESVDEAGIADVPPKGFNFTDAAKKPATCYKFGNVNTQLMGIDSSLTKLFECMTLAYSGKLTSPKWKNFKGIKLLLKEKIRLNNIIWREWHMQFIQGQRPIVCQFEPPISDKVHSKPEAVVLEGKYWKRRLESVTSEYQKWRRFFKERGMPQTSENEFVEELMSHTMLLQRLAQQDALRPPWRLASTQLPSSITDKLPYEDEDLMDFSDTLFTSFQDKNFVFPNPREMSGLGNADIIQPALIQLQPNFDDFMMDTSLEPLPSLTEMLGVQTPRSFMSTSEINSMYASATTAGTSISNSSVWSNASASTGAPTSNNFTDLNTARFQPEVSLADNLGLDMFSSSQLMDVNQGSNQAPCEVVQPTSIPPPPPPAPPAPPPPLQATVPQTTTPTPITIATPLGTTGSRLQDASQIINLILQQAGPLHVQLQEQQQQQQQQTLQQALQNQHSRQAQTVRIASVASPVTHISSAPSPVSQPQGLAAPQTVTIIQNGSQLQTLLQNMRPAQPVLDASSIVQALNPSPTVTNRKVTVALDNSIDLRRASNGSLNNLKKITPKKDGDFLVPQSLASRTKQRSLAPAPPGGPVPTTKSSIIQHNSFLAQLLRPQASYLDQSGIRVKQEDKPQSATIVTQTYIPMPSAPPITTASQYTSATNSVTDYQKSLIVAATCKALNTSPAKITEAMAAVVPGPPPPTTQSAPGSPVSPGFSVPSPVFSVPSPSSDCGSPGKPYHVKSDSDRQQYKETRRASHITAEKKRRGNIKDGFDMLHQLVPTLNQNPNAKVSKAATLNKTAEFCKKLKSERATMQKEAEILKQEIEALNSSISVCQQQLPATGVPVTRQRVDQMRDMFDEYVRARTLQNWKFWIFSIIIRPLFDTYNNMVSTASMEELCRTVLAWLEQHCSLVALRPGVLNSLRHLSTSTSILSDPSRVPEQAAQAVARKPNHPS